MYKALLRFMRHDILLTMRQAHAWLTPLLFFIIIVCLFPLAMGPDDAVLKKIAPGLIWVAALLAIVMSIDKLFRQEAEDGCLDLFFLSPYPLTLLVFCKIVSHWIMYCLPLIVVTPILALLLHVNAHAQLALLWTLLLGTPVLCLLGAVGAALTVGIRNHGLLLPILIMPMYIPVLIFGTGTVLTAASALPINGYLALMGALMLISLGFAPLFTALALRIGVNQ